MREVVVRGGDSVVRLTNATAVEPRDTYSGGTFVAELQAPGLHATRQVFVFDGEGLTCFLTEVAEAWRGWQGPKEWASPDHDLTVAVECDRQGHNTFSFTLRDGPISTWSAHTAVVIAAGEDTAAFAADVSHLLADLRGGTTAK